MTEDLFAQTMPLFGSGPRYRAERMLPASQQRRPWLMAIGSSCRVPHVATTGTHIPSSAATATSSTNLDACNNGIAVTSKPSLKALSGWQPFPPSRKHHKKVHQSERSGALADVLWEEQVARLQLQCEEQEDRVCLALAKALPQPRIIPPFTRIARSAPLRGEASKKTIARKKGGAAHATPASESSSTATEKERDGWTPQMAECTSAGHPSAPHSTATVQGSFYVRDSELLRALQRAEARIRELEVRLSASTHAQTGGRSCPTGVAAESNETAFGGAAGENIYDATLEPDVKRNDVSKTCHVPFSGKLTVL